MLPIMDAAALGGLLDDVAAGRIAPGEAATRLARLPWADLGHSRVDHHRALRQGLPEAVYGPGKAVDHVVEIRR
jgi:pyridinium-3,5-biscarboxylic acid mononucleotide synthase